jgi:hypothetical protein
LIIGEIFFFGEALLFGEGGGDLVPPAFMYTCKPYLRIPVDIN